jgi:hypothetical protein
MNVFCAIRYCETSFWRPGEARGTPSSTEASRLVDFRCKRTIGHSFLDNCAILARGIPASRIVPNAGATVTQADLSFPNVIYKFMSSRFSDDFLSGRSVRLGTLGEFRNTELHRLNKGDPNEGAFNIKGDKPWTMSPTKHSAMHRALFNVGLRGTGNQFRNNGIDIRIVEPDCNVFCTARSFSEAIAQDLDDEYDICVEIKNTEAFIQALGDGIHKSYSSSPGVLAFDPVRYDARTLPPTASSFDRSVFLKDTKFQKQDEFRIVYCPEGKAVEPKIFAFDASKCAMKKVWEKAART